MEKHRERQSNIELLRIISILGVIVLHYNNPSIGKALTLVQQDSLNFYLLYILESIFACAVNLFIMISGYFLCLSGNRNIWKAIQLLIQVSVFSSGLYLVQVILGGTFEWKMLFFKILPINYFAVIYVVLYIISPYINLLLNQIDEKNAKNMLLLFMVFFSIWPTFVDVVGELTKAKVNGLSPIGAYGSQWGYTIINFMLMYIIGACIRKYQWHNSFTIKQIVFTWLAIVAILVIWARINLSVGFEIERSAWEYCNPLLILEAAIVLLLFSKIKMKNHIVINRLAKAGFTVFLLHTQFFRFLNIEKVVNKNIFVLLTHIVLCSIIIYLICFVVYEVYDFIAKPIFKRLGKINRKGKYE